MSFGLSIDQLSFSSGDEVALPRSGMVLVVGPNNAGKSRLLKELAGEIGAIDRVPLVVLKSVSMQREGTHEDFWSWICGKYRVAHDPSGTVSVSGIGIGMSGGLRVAAKSAWTDAPRLGVFGRTVLSYLSTATRLSDSSPVPSFDAISLGPDVPLQALYLNYNLEERISSVFRSAFDEDLILDRLGGTQLALRCGRRPSSDPVGLLSMEYGTAVRALPSLHEQGDGMRSFVSCILHTEVLERPFVLVDEPEAFLHPPQAARLSKHLALTAKTTARQVFVATHSSDIVRGAIDSGTTVAVVRLSRSEQGNRASYLNSDAIKSLWKDPLLRASNLLDALFHQRAIVCEADGDCRFYSAVVEALCVAEGRTRPDALFTHTGGKHRLAMAVNALKAVAVPVTVVADLDTLSEEEPLRSIWQALGHGWEEIARDHKIVKAAVDQTLRPVNVDQVRTKIDAILGGIVGGSLDKRTAEAVRDALRAEGGWAHIKRAGVAAIPKGDARKSCDDLLTRLAEGGLHLVTVGELEGFAPHVPGHGPKWLDGALQLNLSSDVPDAANFVRKLGLVGVD